MSRVAVVYWSGTGNTESMAKSILEGVKSVGVEAELIIASNFNSSLVEKYDAIAFGCSAMGAEVLEEDEFQPMWDEVLPVLKGKKISLFGSYDWGNGEWIRNWEEECINKGLTLACDFIMSNNEPTELDKENLVQMGITLAK